MQARNRRRLNIRNRVGGKSLNYWSTGVMGQGLLRGLWWGGHGWGKVDNTRHKCHSDNLIVPARGPAQKILQALLSDIEYMASKSKPNYFDKHETLFSLFLLNALSKESTQNNIINPQSTPEKYFNIRKTYLIVHKLDVTWVSFYSCWQYLWQISPPLYSILYCLI